MPSGRTQLIHDSDNFALTALAAGAAVVDATKVDGSRAQGVTLKRVVGHIAVEQKTAGQGPLIIGIAAEENAANIAEAFAADPQRFGAAGSAEEANRRVLPMLTIADDQTGLGNISPGNLQDGRWWDWNVPSWKLEEGQNLVLFAYNADPSVTNDTGLVWWEAVFVTRWLDD